MVCAREAAAVEDITYMYPYLEVGVKVVDGPEAADLLKSGSLRDIAQFAPPDREVGIAHWVTSGGVYGKARSLSQPSYYYEAPLSVYFAIPDLSLPLFAVDLPYYPRGDDAVSELLFGITRYDKPFDFTPQVVIRLPYELAAVHRLYYAEGRGVVSDIVENQKDGAAGHMLHLAWKADWSDSRLARAVHQVTAPGEVAIEVDVDPAYVSVALLDKNGSLVDSAERYRPDEPMGVSVPLHPGALPEALDFLASVWHVAFHEPLIMLSNTTIAAALAVPCVTRADFESRLSSVDAVMKAMTIPDILLAAEDRGRLKPSETFMRMRSALGTRLSGPDLDSAQKAVNDFSAVNRLRVALQHPETAKPDLPSSLARFGIGYPPSWPDAWETVRARLITAAIQLRNALL